MSLGAEIFSSATDRENGDDHNYDDDLSSDNPGNRYDAHDGGEYLTGGIGNDTLVGGMGSDDLSGGLGDDLIIGGQGDDYLSGDDGYEAGLGGNDTLYGGEGDDILVGQGGNDVLFGGPGDDELFGGQGDDYLHGGDGFDQMAGGDGNDTLVAGRGGANVSGGAGDDLLIGGFDDASVYLNGGAGNDTIIPGTNDWAEGQEGADVFELHEGVTMVDIGDFDPENDRLLLVLDEITRDTPPEVVVRSDLAGDAILIVNGDLIAKIYRAGGLNVDAIDIEYRAASEMFHVKHAGDDRVPL